MYIVYILRSLKEINRVYIGKTEDLNERVKQHNRGDSAYTKKFLPWVLETYISFSNKQLVDKFEKYLKSGSGHAFLKSKFIPNMS